MNLFTKAYILGHIAHWRLTWNRRDTGYRQPGLDPKKFITAHEAAKLIRDGATCFSSGMAGNARCSIFFWAIRELFEKTGHPRDLTWITVGAQGSRGRAPGTVEEIGLPGLVTTLLTGHLETVKSMLKLADEGQIELHTMPQGVSAFLLEAQMRGELTFDSETGVGTFVDPRVGGGTYVGGAPETQNFVAAANGKLRYRYPKLDCNFFVAPYADAEGNIYKRNAATMTEAYESSFAAKKSGGTVIASVCSIIPKNEKEIFIPADQVDYIVVNPRSEQTGSIQQRIYWPGFTAEHRVNAAEEVEKLKFANAVLKITPTRTPIELATARLAASMFMNIVKKGALINIGVGLAEEVSRLMYEGGLHQDVTFFTETGVYGGMPAPGIFFGSAINPLKLITSAQIFHLAEEKLDATVLGVLEVDSDGNVNVSKRGPRCLDYVGPGGLPDLAAAARNIVFVGSWMAHADIDVIGGQVRIRKPGTIKFKDKVAEITFNGRVALAKGKKVFYVTNVGAFQLTERGMTLIRVMPGIDIRRDILDATPMKIVLPEDGRVAVVPPDVVTGEGFRLHWPGNA
jgi:propionate CoA-transferase